MSQKKVLAAALGSAQKAVKLDSENDVVEALDAYNEACHLLAQVLGDETVRDDRRKLKQIYETYSDRIRLLAALHPQLSTKQSTNTRDYEPYPKSKSYKERSENKSPQSHASARDNAASGNYQMVRETHHMYHAGQATIALGQGYREESQRSSKATAASAKGPSSPFASSSSVTIRERRAMTLESRARNPLRYSPRDPLELVLSNGSSSNGQKRSSQSVKLAGADHQEGTGASSLTPAMTSGYAEIAPASSSDLSSSAMDNFSRASPSESVITTEYIGSIRKLDRDKERRRSLFIQPDVRSLVPSTVPGPSTNALKSFRKRLPKDPLARPYWIMRLLLATFATSPRVSNGIFLTDSLYIPRDLWTTKNVKIKGEEEKIQAYGLVVQELQRLGQVDKNDTDSLLKSLDQLELMLSKAQTMLTKKLGSEVIESSTLMSREVPATPAKKSSSLSFAKFLKGSTGGDRDTGPASLSKDFEGEHVLLQRTLSQLFGLAQLLEQINLNLNTESLSVKDQLRLDQTYNRAADFFSRIVVKLYLSDVSQLLHCRLANKLDMTF